MSPTQRTLRTIAPPPLSVRERPHCTLPGCDMRTREAKPYCPEHVEQHEYVQQLLERLEAREKELSRVRRRGARAVELDGIAAREVLSYLRCHGPRTVRRIARDLNLELCLARAFVEGLKRQGALQTRRTRRRRVAAELTSSAAA